MNVAEIKKMSNIERLHAMEELWDALCHEKQYLDSPLWHEKILEERKKKIETGKAEFISIDELTARLSQ